MSHTPILVFCLGSRPLFPLGGGNVAALQHEGRVSSMRGPWGEGRCCPAPLGSYLPSSRASEEEEQEGHRGALNGQRYCLH